MEMHCLVVLLHIVSYAPGFARAGLKVKPSYVARRQTPQKHVNLSMDCKRTPASGTLR
jgi:hypothetical protein